jgi:hypothetical protein
VSEVLTPEHVARSRYTAQGYQDDILPVDDEELPDDADGDILARFVQRMRSDRDLTAPQAVREELKRGLAWHKEGHSGDGLKPETVAWATRLASGQPITRDKAVKMSAWLARHEADKAGEGFDRGEDGYPSPGRVSLALRGGDPAIGWSADIVAHFESQE